MTSPAICWKTLGDWTVLSLPAIAEVNENIAIGDGKSPLRRAGEELHSEHESIAAWKGCGVRWDRMYSRPNTSRRRCRLVES
jgi:hypothetical protein